MVSGIEVHRWAIDALFETSPEARASRPLPLPPRGGEGEAGRAARAARIESRIPALKSPRGTRPCKPLHATPAPKDVDLSEFVAGCARLGFSPSAHQRRLARILDALDDDGLPRNPMSAVTEPRRSGKTDGVFGVIIGRCTARQDYHAAFSAQNGKKGRARFLAMAVKLERWDPCPRPSRTSPGCPREHVHYRIYRSNGGERIEWDNGSTLDVLPPDPEVYRGDEYDLVVLDEAQETADQETADELLGGILPTMDTVPGAQLVVAGTAGKTRTGLLWSALERGRVGLWAILEYAAPEHADPLDEATWLAAHPGIGTLTTLAKIRERFTQLSLLDFCREYLGLWPVDSSTSAIDHDQWTKARVEPIARPRRVGLAFDVAPDNSCAAIACAWRDPDGTAYIEVLVFRVSAGWLPAEAAKITTAARAPIAYDVIGRNIAPGQAMARRRPPVRTTTMGVKDQQGAQQRIITELGDGRLRHFGQKDLDLAVEGAVWRTLGEGGRLLGHKASAAPIVPLTAAALALWAFDGAPARQKMTLTTAAA